MNHKIYIICLVRTRVAVSLPLAYCELIVKCVDSSIFLKVNIVYIVLFFLFLVLF